MSTKNYLVNEKFHQYETKNEKKQTDNQTIGYMNHAYCN